MYAYVTCRPDIGYHCTTLSKFANAPNLIHYDSLKSIAKYLRSTKSWGIVYTRPFPDPRLPTTTCPPIPAEKGLPSFPQPETPAQLMGFVDAAHVNDLRNRRSTYGYSFTVCNGVVSYRSKTQAVTATSSTEAEFMAAVVCAKQAKYLRAVMYGLGFGQYEPTPIFEDNAAAILMINSRIPTERARHIDIQHFAIQDWADNQEIRMCHIPGVINPPDNLSKPLGWVLLARHARRMMKHHAPTDGTAPQSSLPMMPRRQN